MSLTRNDTLMLKALLKLIDRIPDKHFPKDSACKYCMGSYLIDENSKYLCPRHALMHKNTRYNKQDLINLSNELFEEQEEIIKGLYK
jgi:hypothetical protein